MNSSGVHTEDSIWQRFRNGDAAAYDVLVKELYTDLFNYGIRFTDDRELVKDCLQDIFLLLWNKRDTLGSVSYVKTYLLTALRRKLKKEKDKQRVHYVADAFEFAAGFDTDLPADHRLVMHEQLQEKVQAVRGMLSQLTTRQQEIIYLRFYLERDMEDIVHIMALNRQSVYNLLHDALKRCRLLCRQMELLPRLLVTGIAFCLCFPC